MAVYWHVIEQKDFRVRSTLAKYSVRTNEGSKEEVNSYLKFASAILTSFDIKVTSKTLNRNNKKNTVTLTIIINLFMLVIRWSEE